MDGFENLLSNDSRPLGLDDHEAAIVTAEPCSPPEPVSATHLVDVGSDSQVRVEVNVDDGGLSPAHPEVGQRSTFIQSEGHRTPRKVAPGWLSDEAVPQRG